MMGCRVIRQETLGPSGMTGVVCPKGTTGLSQWCRQVICSDKSAVNSRRIATKGID